jgi:hypothetical protein
MPVMKKSSLASDDLKPRENYPPIIKALEALNTVMPPNFFQSGELERACSASGFDPSFIDGAHHPYATDLAIRLNPALADEAVLRVKGVVVALRKWEHGLWLDHRPRYCTWAELEAGSLQSKREYDFMEDCKLAHAEISDSALATAGFLMQIEDKLRSQGNEPNVIKRIIEARVLVANGEAQASRGAGDPRWKKLIRKVFNSIELKPGWGGFSINLKSLFRRKKHPS